MTFPIRYNTRAFNFFYDDRLRRPAPVRFRWTDGKICKQGWLLVPALAVEILAYQTDRRFIRQVKGVMCADVPYFEK